MSEQRDWPALVPELVCTDIETSVAFYRDVLGFEVVYSRPEERFAYLRREGAGIMLEQPFGRSFVIARLEHPFGRGMVPMIMVRDVEELYARVLGANASVAIPIEKKWYRVVELWSGEYQFVVTDPDGYLLRFSQHLDFASVPPDD